MKWRTYWLYLGTIPIHSVLLPIGATEAQVKDKAHHDMDVLPAAHCSSGEAPFEHRVKINRATVVHADHEFERTTPERYWGYIPPGLLDDPPQPESPWVTAQRLVDAARARVTASRRRRLAQLGNSEDYLGPAI